MQLHHLTLSAIGPFEDTFHIDFGRLGASGLFLLEGPTGSGKSTILDAIVYALYGKVASDQTSDDRMRSDHAADDIESFVDLIFETSHGIYRIIRQPERMRPKKRGTGLKKEQAQVRLFSLTPADLESITASLTSGTNPASLREREFGTFRSGRMDEVGSEIVRVIGLDRHQFAQTIVLPQGEFAQFLRSEPENRRALLQKVFGTEIYERAQEQLGAMKREAEKDVAASEANRREVIRAFAQAAGVTSQSVDELVALGDTELDDALNQEIQRLETLKSVAQDTELAAVTLETLRQEALRHAQRLTELHQQRRQLEQDLETLFSKSAQIEKQREELSSALKASYVMPLYEALNTSNTMYERALDTFVRAVSQAQQYAELGPLDGDLTQAQCSTAEVFADNFASRRKSLMQRRDEDQQILGELRAVKEIEETLNVRDQKLQRDRQNLSRSTEALERLRQETSERPERRAALVEERDRAVVSAGAVKGLEAAVDRIKDALKTFDQLDQVTLKVAQHEQKVAEAAKTATEALDAESAARRAWFSELAGVLAEQLEEGTPCQVCGSPDHPNPARTGAGAVTEDDVERAERERQKAEAALSERTAQREALRAREASLRELIGDATREALTEELEKQKSELESAQKAARDEKALNRDLLVFDTRTAQLADEEKRSVAEVASLASRIAEQETSLTQDRTRVAEIIAQYRDAVSIDGFSTEESAPLSIRDIIDYLQQRNETITLVVKSLDECSQARAMQEQREQELSRGLAEQGFDSAQSALAASRPEPVRESLKRAIAQYDQQVAATKTQLESERFADVPRELNVDLDALKQDFVAAQTAARQASHVAQTAKKQLLDAEFRRAKVAEAVDSVREQRQRIAPIIRMADIATGNSSDNAKRVTLATYVLMRRFEDVVSAANSRLLAMSDGKYELIRSDDKEDVRSRKRGLALKVIDHDTEKARDPRTLSGGETFYASLSLALGLADVVTAEAGGVELGTLFIDEGFGTLDPDALDRVTAILETLRHGGRTVGIVSHVETLKQSIPDRISVARKASGASTLAVRS